MAANGTLKREGNHLAGLRKLASDTIRPGGVDGQFPGWPFFLTEVFHSGFVGSREAISDGGVANWSEGGLILVAESLMSDGSAVRRAELMLHTVKNVRSGDPTS
jgi:hypothetical protein